MLSMNLTPGEIKVIRSHELEEENETLKKRVKELDMKVRAYENASKSASSPEELEEKIDIVREILYPEERINGYIFIREDDMDWLDADLREIIVENHKTTPPPKQKEKFTAEAGIDYAQAQINKYLETSGKDGLNLSKAGKEGEI